MATDTQTMTGTTGTSQPMQMGMVGLGRMGANIVRRLMRDGHHPVGYNRTWAVTEALVGEGLEGAQTLADLAAKLDKPRTVWVMVPAGAITDATISALADVLEA